jgi:phosphoenolpyruvate-protein kinase (PTS system EI component)
MNPAAIPRIKRLMRRASLVEMEELLARLMQLPTAREVVATLEAEMHGHFPEIFESAPL